MKPLARDFSVLQISTPRRDSGVVVGLTHVILQGEFGPVDRGGVDLGVGFDTVLDSDMTLVCTNRNPNSKV